MGDGGVLGVPRVSRNMALVGISPHRPHRIGTGKHQAWMKEARKDLTEKGRES